MRRDWSEDRQAGGEEMTGTAAAGAAWLTRTWAGLGRGEMGRHDGLEQLQADRAG